MYEAFSCAAHEYESWPNEKRAQYQRCQALLVQKYLLYWYKSTRKTRACVALLLFLRELNRCCTKTELKLIPPVLRLN